MTNKEKRARIKSLENIILYHKYLYYNGKAIITDYEYDQIEQELKNLYPESKVITEYLECPRELWPKYEKMYQKYVVNEN